ncbi:MAG: prepilin-type N-terminal cleavage/methylation domain-containing protein [Deltaproteobacteria bacterium]|nr:prepilin-type N-terminal cleavage/methylation domain-containing protein [Deltaproteobacteria bacterium]
MKPRLFTPISFVRRSAAGFSLIEMLVSLFVASLMMTVMSGFVSTVVATKHNTSLVTEAQQGVRSLLSMITQELRQAGACLTPLGTFISLDGANTATQDSLTLRIGRVNTATTPPTNRCIQPGTTAEANPGSTTLQVPANSGLRAGDQVFITPNNVLGDFYTVQAASGTTVTLAPPLEDYDGLGTSYPVGTGIYPFDERVYAVDASDPDRPVLTAQINGAGPFPLVDGVKLFDVRYGLAPCDPQCATEVAFPLVDDDTNEWFLVREVRIKATVQSHKKNREGEFEEASTGKVGESGEYITIKPRNLL